MFWRPLMGEKTQPLLRRALALAVLRHAAVLIRRELLPHVIVGVVRVEALPLPALPVRPVLEDDALRQNLLHGALARGLPLRPSHVPFADPEVEEVRFDA